MIADAVPLAKNVGNQIWMSGCFFTDHKEGGCELISGQEFEQYWCGRGRGAVIKGEGYSFAFCYASADYGEEKADLREKRCRKTEYQKEEQGKCGKWGFEKKEQGGKQKGNKADLFCWRKRAFLSSICR